MKKYISVPACPIIPDGLGTTGIKLKDFHTQKFDLINKDPKNMSGKIKIKLEKTEWQIIKKFLKNICVDGKCIFPPKFKEIPVESKLRGIYVEFKGGLLSFDYASWDFHNSAYSLYLAQEILKHFKVLKVGYSIGWCAIDEFKKHKGFVPVEKILKGIPSLRKKMKRSVKRLIEKLFKEKS